MIDGHAIEQIISALRGALPQKLADDTERNVRAAVGAMLERLDLVTREELDVQTAVLARTRAMLTELEKRIAELERKSPGA